MAPSILLYLVILPKSNMSADAMQSVKSDSQLSQWQLSSVCARKERRAQ